MVTVKVGRIAAAIALATSAVSATVLSASPAHAAGGCVNKSQSGWTIRLCASKDFTTAYSDFYVLQKGTTGNSCMVVGSARIVDEPDDYNNWSCASIGINQRGIIGAETVIGGVTITTCVTVEESVAPFRTFFYQCQTFTDV